MTESQFQTKLLKELRSYGWFYKASDRFRAGVPDVIGCFNGVFIAIELKVDYNKPTKLQVFELKQILANEGYAAVVTYNNKTKTRHLGDKTFKTDKELVECILKQSLLSIKSTAFRQLEIEATLQSSLNQA